MYTPNTLSAMSRSPVPSDVILEVVSHLCPDADKGTLYSLLFLSPYLRTDIEQVLYRSMTRTACSRSHDQFLETVLHNKHLASYVQRFALVIDSNYYVYVDGSSSTIHHEGRNMSFRRFNGAVVPISTKLEALTQMTNIRDFTFYEKNRNSSRPLEMYRSILMALRDAKLRSFVWHVAGPSSFRSHANVVPVAEFLLSQPDIQSLALCTQDVQVDTFGWRPIRLADPSLFSNLRHVEGSLETINKILPGRRITSVTIQDFHVRCTLENLALAATISEWNSIEFIHLHSWGDEATINVLRFISTQCHRLKVLHFPAYIFNFMNGLYSPTIFAPLMSTLEQLYISFRPSRRCLEPEDPLKMADEAQILFNNLVGAYFMACASLREVNIGSYVSAKPNVDGDVVSLKAWFQKFIPVRGEEDEGNDQKKICFAKRDGGVVVEMERICDVLKMWPLASHITLATTLMRP